MTEQAINYQVRPEPVYCPTRRGESNRLRKGQPKIHCHHIAVFSGTVPRGAAAKVVARIRQHDWNRNSALVALRQRGYIPYRRRNDPSYIPKPMRVSTREESRRALTALSLALAANCDYNPDADYPFEIIAPFEEIARVIGVLHIYENGRKSCDVATHARDVMEELDYLVVHRAWDADAGQYKAMRIFLTERFFTSRGISVEEIRLWLHGYRQWAIVNGLTESLRKKHERHQLRMARLGIDIDSHHSLKNRLRQIKRWVVSPDLLQEKKAIVEDLGKELDELASKMRTRNGNGKIVNRYQMTWVRWSTSVEAHPIKIMQLKRGLTEEHPSLERDDPEQYYRLLLERAGVLH